MLTPAQAFAKRSFDLLLAISGIILTGWLILLAWLIATVDTRSNGMFTQLRVGKNGHLFRVFKIRTMRPQPNGNTTQADPDEWSTVTTASDDRITRLGRLWRKTKIDELPQLVNVLLGQMSFVGPRPDVPGFADKLQGDDRIILAMRPGITGPATLRFRDEENLLASVDDPEKYNREVIFPEKVKLNREYLENWSLWRDIIFIWQTIFTGRRTSCESNGDPC